MIFNKKKLGGVTIIGKVSCCCK